MTASSQNPPGPQALEPPYAPVPLHAAVASHAAAIPAPAGPVSPVVAAAGVITAAMEQGHTAPAEIADAEAAAGILFDPQRAKDIEDAAREQARAESSAELADVRRQLDAVARLLEGRPAGDFLSAAEVARAIEYGTTSLDAYPMTLTWRAKYGVDIPGPGDVGGRAVVRCRSSHGQAADLVVEGDDRQALAGLLDLEVRDIHATCPTDGCGTVDDYDASDPSLFGWSRLQVAALGDEARWYCSDMCVVDALARAGHELAAADRRAELDGAL